MILPEILPSLLAADFARLGEEIAKVEAGGATMLHVDIMDGHFVPNLTMGPPVVKSIRKITKSILDVHLMIEDADTFAPVFIEAGADQVSVHQEACRHLDRTLHMIRSHGAKAGIVLNPATPVSSIEDVLEIADFVLVMSVNPGFGGQSFIPRVLNKVRHLDALRRERGLDLSIEIDGGIGAGNVEEVVKAGVNWLVAGTSVFGTPDPAEAVRHLSSLARQGTTIRV